MGMRIQTNVQSLVAQRHLQNNSSALTESMEKLSSGHRINKSKDDPAGLGISEVMRGKIRGLTQAKRNAGDAISMLQVAEGSMNEMTNILIRMRELTVQSSTDTLGDRERSYLNKEYTQLVSELDRIAQTSEYNGNKFFVTGDRSEYVIQVGTNNSPVGSNQDTISINLEDLKFNSKDLGLGTSSEIGPVSVGDRGPDGTAIREKLTVVDNALNTLANQRSNIGSLQSRLESTTNNLMINIENLSTAKGRIKDVDIAEETANLSRQKILTQSNMSMLAQANQMPEMALALLRQA